MGTSQASRSGAVMVHGDADFLVHVLGALAAGWVVLVCLAALSPWGLPSSRRAARLILMPGLLLMAGTVGAIVGSWQ